MRCPTCGIENEPDSRFCGGCGARIGAQPQPRLAPTHKIQDDAPYPQHASQPAVLPAGPVSYAPPSLPPSAPVSVQPQPPLSIATPTPGAMERSSRSPAASPGSQPPPSLPTEQLPPSPPGLPAPGWQGVGSAPPTGGQRAVSTPQRTGARPHISATSESFAAPPQRPIGLLVAVLLFDIGLAIAGGVLLVKGLAKDDAKHDSARDASSEPAERRTEAPSPPAQPAATARVVEPAGTQVAATAAVRTANPSLATTAAPAAGASPAIAAAPARTTSLATAAATPSAPAARKDATKPRDDKKVAPAPSGTAPAASASTTTPRPGANTATAPSPGAPTTTATAAGGSTARDDAKPAGSELQDPYPAVDTNREIDAAAAKSKSALERCEREHAPAPGKVVVAFQVRPDGRVANVAAVENTTGNSELARCFVAEVSSWRVSGHGGAAIDMSRAFNVR